MIHDYVLAFACYWFGFLTCAALVIGRERHAAMVGNMGGKAEREHRPSGIQDPPAPAEAVVVGDILKAKTRVSREQKNGEVK